MPKQLDLLEVGLRVRTVEPDEASDEWSLNAIRSRQWNVVGFIGQFHDVEGRLQYYDVIHIHDRTTGSYELRELEKITE